MEYNGIRYLTKFFRPFEYRFMTGVERWSWRIFWIVAALLLWQFEAKALNPLWPTPTGILEALARLYARGLSVDAMTSAGVILLASFLIALPLGLVLSWMNTMGAFRDPVRAIATMRNAPTLVFIIGGIMMQFQGHNLKVLTMAFVILVFFLSSRIYASQSKGELDHGLCMRMTPWQILWQRTVRGKMHLALNDFVPCIGMGWAMLAMIEGLSRTEGGLGDLILQQDKINSLEGIGAIALVGILLGWGITALLRWYIRWQFPYATRVAITS